jgi:uncharacterized protein (DUF58 family)
VSAPGAGASVVRWRPRAFFLLGLAGSLLFLAVFLASSVPAFLAIPFLVAPLIAPWSAPTTLGKVDLVWTEQGNGPDIWVGGRLSGDLGTAGPDVRVDFTLPPGITEVAPVRFGRREPVVEFYTRWQARDPIVVDVPPPKVSWEDPYGLSRRDLPGERPSLRIRRYPLGLRSFSALRLDRTTMLPGETHSRRVGDAGEFFGLRVAPLSAPLRRVNWRATARAGRPMTNEFQVDRAGDLVLLVDARPSPLGPAYSHRMLGVTRAVALGLSESFLRQKIRVGYASFGEFVEALPLSTGRVHALRIQEAIARTQPAPVPGLPERCAYGLARYFRPGTAVLVLSGWVGEPETDLTPYLRRRGYPVILLSPSTVPLGRGAYALTPEAESAAAAVERLERRARLAYLWSYGPVIDWEELWSLSALVHYLRHPVTRRAP